jgi:hypothetical protein
MVWVTIYGTSKLTISTHILRYYQFTFRNKQRRESLTKCLAPTLRRCSVHLRTSICKTFNLLLLSPSFARQGIPDSSLASHRNYDRLFYCSLHSPHIFMQPSCCIMGCCLDGSPYHDLPQSSSSVPGSVYHKYYNGNIHLHLAFEYDLEAADTIPTQAQC